MERQLFRAVSVRNNLPTVRRILQQAGEGFNVNAPGNEDGWTALHLAITYSHDVAIVQAILQADGVNVNARSVTAGLTPLHLAWNEIASRLSNNDRRLITLALLQAGADPNAADDDGFTPLFYYVFYFCPLSTVEALLDAGANPAVRNRILDTPLHAACFRGRLDVVQLLIQRQGFECLTLKNNREETPLDRLTIDQDHPLIPGRVAHSIRQHMLQSYAGMIAQHDGLLCLHSVLQEATFMDGNQEEFQLPVGKLNTEYLQILLEYIIAAEPGSVRALDRDGLLPLQVAIQLNFPDLVVNVLLRPYPDALLLL